MGMPLSQGEWQKHSDINYSSGNVLDIDLTGSRLTGSYTTVVCVLALSLYNGIIVFSETPNTKLPPPPPQCKTGHWDRACHSKQFTCI